MNNSTTQQQAQRMKSSFETMKPDGWRGLWNEPHSIPQIRVSEEFRILVVDDDLGLRKCIAMTLEEPDVFVRMAENGLMAVQMLKMIRFDLVISDVNMPGMDGIQLLQWVDTNRPDTQVIMMSGEDPDDSLLRLLHAGSHEFLLKLFSLDDLENAVERNRKRSKTVKAEVWGQTVLTI